MSTRVFVTVGTDHHPFTRLIEWVDHWADTRTDLDLVVQHGTAPPARHGENHELLDTSDIVEQYATADLVISQVGPGTIADANRAGHRPFVVPRDPALGEVVDDHQMAFGDFMAARGRCVSIRTRDHLIAELEAWLSASQHPALPSGALPSTTSTTLAALSRSVLAAPRRRFSARRLLTVVRPALAADAAL
ncbi:MAG TPA: glycosyltransferase [Brachybacterium sp.]|nr:glycosyltransferase [Brachybacterium sp.]